MYNIFTHHQAQPHLPTHLIPAVTNTGGIGSGIGGGLGNELGGELESGFGNGLGMGNGSDDVLVAEDDGEGSDGENEGLTGLGLAGEGSQGMLLQVGERVLEEAEGEAAQSEHDAFRAYLVRSLGNQQTLSIRRGTCDTRRGQQTL